MFETRLAWLAKGVGPFLGDIFVAWDGHGTPLGFTVQWDSNGSRVL